VQSFVDRVVKLGMFIEVIEFPEGSQEQATVGTNGRHIAG